MAVITEKKFNEILLKFRTITNYYYEEPVENLLGVSWTKSELQNTMIKFTNSSENLSAESYSKNNKTYIKIYRTDSDINQNNSSDDSNNRSFPVRYFKKSVFYIYKYLGDIKLLPDWVINGHSILPTGKANGEFKLIIAEDDWFLIQENDFIVYDVDKNRFTIYDSPKEIAKIFISEEEILATKK